MLFKFQKWLLQAYGKWQHNPLILLVIHLHAYWGIALAFWQQCYIMSSHLCFFFPPGGFISCPHQNAETAPSIRSMACKGDVIKMCLTSWQGKLSVSRGVQQADRNRFLKQSFHISRYCIKEINKSKKKKKTNQKTKDSNDIIAIHWNTTAASPACNATRL